jgi:hypothetical protein
MNAVMRPKRRSDATLPMKESTMLDNSQNLTVVSEDDTTLTKIDQTSFASTYRGKDPDSNTIVMSVKHTPTGGMSHMARLDRTFVDSETGVTVRKESAWLVMKTTDGIQDDDSLSQLATALCGLAADNSSALIGLLVNGES